MIAIFGFDLSVHIYWKSYIEVEVDVGYFQWYLIIQKASKLRPHNEKNKTLIEKKLRWNLFFSKDSNFIPKNSVIETKIPIKKFRAINFNPRTGTMFCFFVCQLFCPFQLFWITFILARSKEIEWTWWLRHDVIGVISPKMDISCFCSRWFFIRLDFFLE